MGFWGALLVCALVVWGLFRYDREKSTRTSKAIWLPVLWLSIIGSRPASAWLNIWFGINFGSSGAGLDAQLDGSPTDAAVLGVLLAAGMFVLGRRKSRVRCLLRGNFPVILYFTYCLASVLWSPFPEVAFKRWLKAIADLTMALIVVTESDPAASLRRLFSWVGFLLLPASILLIRYSALGRGYDPDGHFMNTGVTTNKNSLGLITFLIALGALWSFIHAYRSRPRLERTRQLYARGALLALAVTVLMLAHSATSGACFILGGVLIVATHLPYVRQRRGRIHALVLTVLATGGAAILLGGESGVLHALGRDATLTGRTDIWRAVIPLCPNPLIGAGFESFWNGFGDNVRGLSTFQRGINSAHNGYIDVYLNLGWVGLSLIAFILVGGYRRTVATFRRNPELAGLMLAFVATSAIYSVTEAGFRILTPTWICLLLAALAPSGGVTGPAIKIVLAPGRSSLHRGTGAPIGDALPPPFSDKVSPSFHL
jgi:O-antigen ligase